MNRTWNFTDLEFVVAWETAQADILPAPFIFTSRTKYYDDYQREKREIREQLRGKLDRSFDSVLDVVARPDIRVELHGWGSDEEDAESQIRLLAVRREGYGYLLKQLPGETAWHSGGYTVTECAPLALAEALTAELPEVDAGKLADIALVKQTNGADLDFSYGRSFVEDSFDDTVEQLADQFLRTPTTGEGIIEIAQGISRFGPRGVARKRLYWRDLDGDGRYAITAATPPVAVAADTKRLTTLVNSGIAEVIKAIKDERR
ncbi:ESX secretion-associated protein EspG [Nocardia sp. NPDC023852]|uniref:ESX secretion-associated protein EspG n=1 Tax=Nocardia sp. NPDC023852 TaxID=3154697 RepID=UPI0033C40ADD